MGALEMVKGGPPPWLVNMQRYGPPPSYANLKIPGLNAPIPEGATYGYHAGGWGKPPVDEFGRPLYGDVFGTAESSSREQLAEGVSREPWGAMEAEEEEEDDEDEDEDGEVNDNESLMTDDDVAAGISSVSSTAASGIGTPDALNLRKAVNDGLGTPSALSTATGLDTPESVQNETPKALYQVLEQTSAKVGGAAFGSSHGYVVPPPPPAGGPTGGGKAKAGPPGVGGGGVDGALDPSELEHLDEKALKARYEQQRQADRAASAPEDVSDIIEEQERKRRRKEEGASRGGRR